MIPVVNCLSKELEVGDIVQTLHTRERVVSVRIDERFMVHLCFEDIETGEQHSCVLAASIASHDIIGGRKADAIANGTAVVKAANDVRRVAHWVGYKETEVLKEAV